MTVSRVVNKCGNVRKETEQRVLEAIRELSYVPNAAARALNNKRTNNIGVVLPKKEYLLTAPFYIELLLSVEKYLRVKGYNLFLGSLHDDEAQRDYSNLYKEGKVDGLIVFAPLSGDSFLTKLVNDNIPFTVVLGRCLDNSYSYTDVDNFGSALNVVNYLIGLNHKRIGFVSGNIREVNAADRLEGYKAGLDRSGISYDEKLVFAGDWSLESGYKALNSFRTLDNPPTAVFCSNDYMAMGMIKAASDCGLKVPGDLSVAGFDDLQYSAFITPSLTTTRQPVEQLGKNAAQMILARISGTDYTMDGMVLGAGLIIRQSCRTLT